MNHQERQPRQNDHQMPTADRQVSGSDRLVQSIHRARRQSQNPSAESKIQNSATASRFSLDPSNAFEVAVAEQIRAMRQDLDRLEARLWWLFALVVGAAATNVIVGLFS